MAVEKNPFLICRNCINWGHTWKLKWRARDCSNVRDENGKFFTINHAACRHFIPKQGALPLEIQKLRLFVQALTPAEADYFSWAMSQRDALQELKDKNNQELALGDFVQFRHGIQSYYGTVEGVDPDSSDVIVINSPAFDNATITLVSSTVRKLTLQELKDLIRKELPAKEKENFEWQIAAIENEIAAYRAKGLDALDLEERFELANLEVELRHRNSLLRYYYSF